MASSSSVSSSIYSRPSSRFSTLKVFKFASRDKDTKPPPLPPKDSYYLRNRSLASLSPDSLSIPPTSPLSPGFQASRRLSPEMNNSSMSLVSSAASTRSFSPADSSSVPTQKKGKGPGFFKFVKRGPKSPSTTTSPDNGLPPPPSEDENISLPWNFQHNIHVDEGYTGLPPSWTTSLTQAGFTDEEIADIQNRRRTGARSPSSQYLYTDRPASPTNSSNPRPVITHPTPRSTSLPRQFSNASTRRGQHGQRSPHPPVTTLVASPSIRSLQSNGEPRNRIAPPRQFSEDQSSTHHPSPSLSLSSDSHFSNNSTNFSQEASIRAGTVSPPGTESFRPSTPPRRTYHVANELSTIHSPPPSYTHFPSPPNGHSTDTKDATLFDQPSHLHSVNSTPRSHSTATDAPAQPTCADTITQKPRQSTDSLDMSDSSMAHSTASSVSNSPTKSTPRRRTSSFSKRLTARPPRLSLHKTSDSTDLATWGEALLSGISTASADTTPSSSTFAAAQDAKLISSPRGGLLGPGSTITSNYPRIETSTTSQPLRHQQAGREDPKRLRQAPPTRPVPSPLQNGGLSRQKYLTLDLGEDESALSSAWVEPSTTARYDPDWNQESEQPTPSSIASPLWSELEDIVKGDSREEQVYSAALNEASSPTLPFSPGVGLEVLINGRRGVDVSGKSSHANLLSADGGRERGTNRDSSRSSTSTVTGLTEQPTIVRNVSVARRAGAYVIDKSQVSNVQGSEQRKDQEGNNAMAMRSTAPRSSPPAVVPPSPLSSNFGSEEGSASGSGSSSSLSQDYQTPTTDAGLDSPLLYYLEPSPAPSPDPSKLSFLPAAHHRLLVSTTDTFGGVHKEDQAINGMNRDEEEEEEDYPENITAVPASKPKIVISEVPTTSVPTSTTSGTAPLSPFQQYRGWLSAVVAPLEEYIDEAVDPRDYYLDLQEIAEGESGSVYAARLAETNIHKLKLPPLIKAQDSDNLANGRATLVAIKSVAILPTGSPKLIDLERELSLMKGLWHDNILSMDAVYVDLAEDTLWIRMELMERSLADIIGLVGEGLVLQDRTIARFASDILQALEYLQKHRIAHRDVRSDNLLLNGDGVLKLADFSTAVHVTTESPLCSDIAGVVYWQAPEVRTPPYDALKVDVWSLGATVWEMAEAEPPFAETQKIGDKWPPLSRPEIFSPGFHDFLRQCSEPPSSRPSPSDLKKNPFIHNACGRPVIIQLLSQCMAIERVLQERDTSLATDST